VHILDDADNQIERVWLSANGTLIVPAGRKLQLENPSDQLFSVISVAEG
jgi:hypothetical protein